MTIINANLFNGSGAGLYDIDASKVNGITPATQIALNLKYDKAGGTISGAVVISSTLNVSGASTLTGNTTVGGTLGVTGSSTLAALVAAATSVTTLGASGAVTLSSTLGVTGTSTLGVLNAGATGVTTLAASSNATVGGTLGVTGAVTLSSTLAATGNITTNGSLTVGNGATASYIYMTDTDEGTRIIHCNSNRVGFLNQAGGWGSWCNDDGTWQSGFDLIAGGTVTAGGAVNAASVMYVGPGNGYQFNGYAADGGGGYYCTLGYGSPNYGWFAERFWHQSGSWVGWQVQSSDGKTLRWSGQTGSLNADSFTPWSDRRLKDDIQPIQDARSKVAALVGSTYTLNTAFDYDGNPVRKAGLIAQDVLPVLPEAVSLDPLPDPELVGPPSPFDETPGFRYSLDYNGVLALLVNDNNALAARIEALEAQVAVRT